MADDFKIKIKLNGHEVFSVSASTFLTYIGFYENVSFDLSLVELVTVEAEGKRQVLSHSYNPKEKKYDEE